MDTTLNLWTNAKDPNNNTMITLQLSPSSSTDFNIVGTDLGPSTAYIGYTDPVIVTNQGEIIAACIELNTNVYWSTYPVSPQYDIGSTVAHEAGHVLGIAHCHENNNACSSPTCPYNMMSPGVDPGVSKTSLYSYDTSSYALIYYYDYYNFFGN